MARKNINLGTNANDNTGDKLRDAMAKVNDNLIELYNRTGGDATLTGIGVNVVGNIVGVDGAMTITTNQNGNLTIAAPTILTADLTVPNGRIQISTTEVDLINTLLVGGNAKVKGNTVLGDNVNNDTLTINGTISSTLTPTNSITYDIGTTSLRYRDAFIGGTTYTSMLNTPNANINGGTINNTLIGYASPTEGRFTILRVVDDAFLGDLLIRDNVISTGTNNSDIEIKPFGTGNLLVTTKVIIGQTQNTIGDAIIKAISTVDGYVQAVVQNLDDGTQSSTDVFVVRDDGNDEENYIDLGINSSTYSNPIEYPIHTAGSSYLYTGNSDLFIGTYTNNDIIFHAGSDMDFSSIAMRIKGDSSNLIIGAEDGSTLLTDTGEKLQVYGDVRVNGELSVGGDITITTGKLIGDKTQINYIIDGGDQPITTGSKKYLGPMNFGGTITAATLLADQTGSIEIEIRKCTYDEFDGGITHPVVGDKISASAPLALSSAVKSQNTTLTGWTTSFAPGDIFEFVVNSASTVQWVELTLAVTKG